MTSIDKQIVWKNGQAFDAETGEPLDLEALLRRKGASA